jgi:hypothetical protein
MALSETGIAPICCSEDAPMSEMVSTTSTSRAALMAAAAISVLLAGAVGLWSHYGTAVLYEMILAGMAACL